MSCNTSNAEVPATTRLQEGPAGHVGTGVGSNVLCPVATAIDATTPSPVVTGADVEGIPDGGPTVTTKTPGAVEGAGTKCFKCGVSGHCARNCGATLSVVRGTTNVSSHCSRSEKRKLNDFELSSEVVIPGGRCSKCRVKMVDASTQTSGPPVPTPVEAPSAPQAMIQTTSSSPTTTTSIFLPSEEGTHAAGPGDSGAAPLDVSAETELLRLEELHRQLLEEQRELKKESRRLKYLSTGKKLMVDASTNTP